MTIDLEFFDAMKESCGTGAPFSDEILHEIEEAAVLAQKDEGIVRSHLEQEQVKTFVRAVKAHTSYFVTYRKDIDVGLHGKLRPSTRHVPIKADVIGPLGEIESALDTIEQAINRLPTDYAMEFEAVVRCASLARSIELRQGRAALDRVKDELWDRVDKARDGHAIEAYLPERSWTQSLATLLGHLRRAVDVVRLSAEELRATGRPADEATRHLAADIAQSFREYLDSLPTTTRRPLSPYLRVLTAVFKHLYEEHQVKGLSGEGYSETAIYKLAVQARKDVSLM